MTTYTTTSSAFSHIVLSTSSSPWQFTIGTLAREKGLSTAVAFVDLSKAFDRVRHQQLLTSLFDIGVSGTALEWFASYLGQRFQRVFVNGELTPFLPVSSGVLQGSVLGPTLFNILLRHLSALTNQLRTKLLSFADDKTLYASRPTAAEAAATGSSALASLTSHLQELGMVINEDKPVVMFIQPRSSPDSQHTICVNGRALSEVSSTRCREIIIDNRLSFSGQCNKLVAKVSRKIGALRRSFRQLSLKARRLYVLCVIQPDLEFAFQSFAVFI